MDKQEILKALKKENEYRHGLPYTIVANTFLVVAFVFGELRGQIATRITLYGREVFDEKSMAPFYISTALCIVAILLHRIALRKNDYARALRRGEYEIYMVTVSNIIDEETQVIVYTKTRDDTTRIGELCRKYIKEGLPKLGDRGYLIEINGATVYGKYIPITQGDESRYRSTAET